MQMNDFSDQTKIFDPATWGWPVHLVGAGGLNNLVGAVLAKMGIKEIHVWDDDILEERNLPTEVGYSIEMCGRHKVDALTGLVRYLMPNRVELYGHYKRVTAETKLSGVVISGVDSMRSRQEIWQAVQNNFLEIPFYIDARSGGENVQIFALKPADFAAREDYETWLFGDDEAARLECGARNIGYIAAIVAGQIGRMIAKFHRNEPIEEFPWEM